METNKSKKDQAGADKNDNSPPLKQLVKERPYAAKAILTAIDKERKQVNFWIKARKKIPMISNDSIVSLGNWNYMSSEWLNHLTNLETAIKSFSKNP